MPYKNQWYIERQVIYAEVWGEQTIEELQQANAEVIEFLNQSDGRLVHVIMNDEKLVKVPVSVLQAQKVLTYTKHPHLGWVMMVGDKDKGLKDAAIEFAVTLLAKIVRARFVRFKTLTESLEHLRKVDTTIDWNATDPAIRA